MPFIGTTALATAGMSAATQAAAMSFAIGADIAIASTVATGASAYSSVAAGKQAEANAKENAAIMQRQAQEEEQAAFFEASRLAERGRRIRGTQRAYFAKQGLQGAGTPLLVLQETENIFNQDIAMILRGGQARAGYRRSQSQISLASGRSAARAGVIGGMGALLSGGSQTYYRYRQSRTT